MKSLRAPLLRFISLQLQQSAEVVRLLSRVEAMAGATPSIRHMDGRVLLAQAEIEKASRSVRGTVALLGVAAVTVVPGILFAALLFLCKPLVEFVEAHLDKASSGSDGDQEGGKSGLSFETVFLLLLAVLSLWHALCLGGLL